MCWWTPCDKPNAQPYFATWHTALDSGGYRYFKAGQPITDAILLAFMTAIHAEDVCYPYLLHFALDQIGDADRTRELFRWQHNYDKRISPVYPWGAPRSTWTNTWRWPTPPRSTCPMAASRWSASVAWRPCSAAATAPQTQPKSAA